MNRKEEKPLKLILERWKKFLKETENSFDVLKRAGLDPRTGQPRKKGQPLTLATHQSTESTPSSPASQATNTKEASFTAEIFKQLGGSPGKVVDVLGKSLNLDGKTIKIHNDDGLKVTIGGKKYKIVTEIPIKGKIEIPNIKSLKTDGKSLRANHMLASFNIHNQHIQRALSAISKPGTNKIPLPGLGRNSSLVAIV